MVGEGAGTAEKVSCPHSIPFYSKTAKIGLAQETAAAQFTGVTGLAKECRSADGILINAGAGLVGLAERHASALVAGPTAQDEQVRHGPTLWWWASSLLAPDNR